MVRSACRYAGRVPAAGRLPAEVQQAIEARLAAKALGPQALVIVKNSAVNAVTVLLNGSGQAGSVGDRVKLPSGISSATYRTRLRPR